MDSSSIEQKLCPHCGGTGKLPVNHVEHQLGVDVPFDLEEWAKANKKPRRAKRYRIRIDKDYKEVTVHSMNGREILGLVGKTPEKYLLSEKFRGGRVEPVKPDQVVEFHLHEIERFQTMALDPTEG